MRPVYLGSPVLIGIDGIHPTPEPYRKGAGSTPEAGRKVAFYPRKVPIEVLNRGLFPQGIQV